MIEIPRDCKGRPTRVSVADALNVLAERAQLDNHPVTFQVGILSPETHCMRFPRVVADCTRPNQIVALPAAIKFRAISSDGPITGHIDQLDGARVELDGKVTLRDGRTLRAVEVTPLRMQSTLNDLQHNILILVLEFLGKIKDCYRPLHAELLPQTNVLDFSLLPSVDESKLEALVAHVQARFPTAGRSRPSRQTIADTLSLCGMRSPRSASS